MPAVLRDVTDRSQLLQLTATDCTAMSVSEQDQFKTRSDRTVAAVECPEISATDVIVVAGSSNKIVNGIYAKKACSTSMYIKATGPIEEAVVIRS